MPSREGFGDLRLADAGFSFEQKRTLQQIHQPKRGRKVAVGDIADRGEAFADFIADKRH